MIAFIVAPAEAHDPHAPLSRSATTPPLTLSTATSPPSARRKGRTWGIFFL